MTESLRILLTEIIDYAGLFPPSNVGMTSAVQNYANYLTGKNAWMLGRFILPVSRLNEFLPEADSVFDAKIWRLSVIADDDLPQTLNQILSFNQLNSDKFVIDTLEIKVGEASEITEAAKIIPKNITAYFEIPPNDILSDFVTALALTKQRAKIRTGGTTQEAFPPTDAIIKFIRICTALNIPFKATAGLHHPVRCIKPLTYEEDAPNGMMHGFLNLFLSACFLRQSVNNSFVHKLMNETDAKNFGFTDEAVSWKEQSVATGIITAARTKNAMSFGSCSFLEPIEDLVSLNIYQ
jgi:hypothetical protein